MAIEVVDRLGRVGAVRRDFGRGLMLAKKLFAGLQRGRSTGEADALAARRFKGSEEFSTSGAVVAASSPATVVLIVLLAEKTAL